MECKDNAIGERFFPSPKFGAGLPESGSPAVGGMARSEAGHNGEMRLFWFAAAGFLAGIAAIGIDCQLAHWFYGGHCPKFLQHLGDYGELFGRGETVALVALLVFVLDAPRRRAIGSLLAYAYLSGLAADLVKMLVVRARPNAFDCAGSAWATFGGWFPLTSAGSGGQSFPSAHVATAVGLSLALVQLYPRGRYVFVAMTVLVGYQRMQAGDHFLSDVLCGAALACAVVAVARKVELPAIRSVLYKYS
jgi:membrane-associated phospholipid phosphatase